MTGGGKATTAGIDFQHRMGAFAMIAANQRLDLKDFFSGLALPSTPVQLSFETRSAIDDLEILCSAGHTLFFQIKTSISLSDATESLFDKVANQFISQHLDNKAKPEDAYILLTSPAASAQITRNLRRILNAIREAPENYEQVPLNKSEKSTLTKYRAVFERAYHAISGSPPTKQDFVHFSKKTFIESLDLESGGSFEKTAKLLLVPICCISPELVWSHLIRSSISYGGSRAVVSLNTIDELLSRYRELPTADSQQQDTDEFADIIAEQSGNWLAGMEFVLIDGFPQDEIVSLAAMRRFSDDGSKRFEFFGDKILVPSWKQPFKIHHRCATLFGMQRFLKENPHLIEGRHLAVLQSEYEEDPDASAAAVAFGEMCDRKFRRNASRLRCLHCGLTVNAPSAYMIEIDHRGSSHSAGLCHRECARAIDRVVGLVEVRGASGDNHLSSFDAVAWGKALMRGQAGVREALELTTRKGAPVPMLWNPENLRQEELGYCVECQLTDGSRQLMRARGKIQRFTKPEAEVVATEYNLQIKKGRENNNPLGYNLNRLLYANYSMLLAEKRDNEEIALCAEAHVVRYSAVMESEIATHEWYAPLCMLIDVDSHRTLSLAGSVPLISDPLKTQSFVDNWRQAGFEIDAFVVRAIENDVDFGQLMHRIVSDDMQAIIDPILDMNRKLLTGVPVDSIKRFERYMGGDAASD